MRERVAWWLQRTGALSAVMGLRRHAPAPMLSIVTYHHIADHDPAYPYDPNVADVSNASGELVMIGSHPGRTRILVWQEGGARVGYSVTVR